MLGAFGGARTPKTSMRGFECSCGGFAPQRHNIKRPNRRIETCGADHRLSDMSGGHLHERAAVRFLTGALNQGISLVEPQIYPDTS